MRKYINQLLEIKILLRHIRTVVLIGLLLNMINQGDRLINLDFESVDLFKFVFTFFVPFAVSLYSAAKANEAAVMIR